MSLPIGQQNTVLNKVVEIKTKEKKKFNYIQDGGHGWLSVSHEDVKTLGIKDKITSSSYMNGTRVFLEEDYDMGIFLKAADVFGWDVEIKHSHVDKASCRSYGSYNVEWIDSPFTVGRFVYFYDGQEAMVKEKTKKGWNLESAKGLIYRVSKLNPLSRIVPSKLTIEKAV